MADDEHPRPGTCVDKLRQLPAIVDGGIITAGNASGINDGAAAVIVGSRRAGVAAGIAPRARVLSGAVAGVAPRVMGLGPVDACNKALARAGLALAQMDVIEINEAFAGQLLGCLAALNDKQYCHDYLGLSARFGEINLDRLNVDGGAISIGHPVGASGARIILHLLQVLKRHNARQGIASLCIGGGLGGAMLIENVSEVQS